MAQDKVLHEKWKEEFVWSVEHEIKGILDKIDNSLNPTVLLLAYKKTEDRKSRFWLEYAGDDSSLITNELDNIYENISEKYKSQPKIFTQDIIGRDKYKERELKEPVRLAIEEQFERIAFNSKYKTFVGWPSMVEDYLVTPILLVNRKIYEENIFHLREIVNEDTFLRVYRPESYAKSIIDLSLNECSIALEGKYPGMQLFELQKTNDDICRDAAKGFMQYIAWEAAGNKATGGYIEHLYSISNLRYEGAELFGKLLICKEDHSSIDYVVKFEKSIRISEHRLIRKLLEMTKDENVYLVSNLASVFGLGKIADGSLIDCDLFEVSFKGQSHWDLYYPFSASLTRKKMMSVEFGQPKYPKWQLDKNNFVQIYKSHFSETTDEDVKAIWELVVTATTQGNGTMLVISKHAEEQAKHFQSQSVIVEKIKLTQEVLESVSTIDGAILIDPYSNCYAIGVILDGNATEKGSRARGARYNSAVRYVNGTEHGASSMILVVSSDGTYEIIDNIQP